MPAKSATLPQLPAEVRRLLKDLIEAVGSELYHAGADAVAEHPILQGKLRLLQRAERLLNKYELER